MGSVRQSSLALAILGLLEIRPLHPYGMQQLIKQWGKEDVINVSQRASIYKMVARLLEAGLVAAVGVERDQNYPERTLFEITAEGREVVTAWLGDSLAVPAREFPAFTAALSFVSMIDGAEAGELLEQRRQELDAQLTELERQAADGLRYGLPRAATLDLEYRIVVLRAEVVWLGSVRNDIDSGELHWTRKQMQVMAEQQARQATSSPADDSVRDGAP